MVFPLAKQNKIHLLQNAKPHQHPPHHYIIQSISKSIFSIFFFFFSHLALKPSTELTSSVMGHILFKYLHTYGYHMKHIKLLPHSYQMWIATSTYLKVLKSIDVFKELDMGVLQALSLELQYLYYLPVHYMHKKFQKANDAFLMHLLLVKIF